MKYFYGVLALGLLLSGCSDSTPRVNTAPVIGNPGDQTANVNTEISVQVMVSDSDSSDLTVLVSASDDTLIASTTAEPDGTSQTIRITPQPDQAGTADITVTVTDDSNNSTSISFAVEFTRLAYAAFVRDVFDRPANGEPQALGILDPAPDSQESFDDLLQ